MRCHCFGVGSIRTNFGFVYWTCLGPSCGNIYMANHACIHLCQLHIHLIGRASLIWFVFCIAILWDDLRFGKQRKPIVKDGKCQRTLLFFHHLGLWKVFRHTARVHGTNWQQWHVNVEWQHATHNVITWNVRATIFATGPDGTILKLSQLLTAFVSAAHKVNYLVRLHWTRRGSISKNKLLLFGMSR